MIEDEFIIANEKEKSKDRSRCRLTSHYLEIFNGKQKETIDLSNLIDIQIKKECLHFVIINESLKIHYNMRNQDNAVIEEWYNLLYKFKIQNDTNREKMNELRKEICINLDKALEKINLRNSSKIDLSMSSKFMMELDGGDDLANSIKKSMIDLKKNSEVTYYETINPEQRKSDKYGIHVLRSEFSINTLDPILGSNEDLGAGAFNKKDLKLSGRKSQFDYHQQSPHPLNKSNSLDLNGKLNKIYTIAPENPKQQEKKKIQSKIENKVDQEIINLENSIDKTGTGYENDNFDLSSKDESGYTGYENDSSSIFSNLKQPSEEKKINDDSSKEETGYTGYDNQIDTSSILQKIRNSGGIMRYANEEDSSNEEKGYQVQDNDSSSFFQKLKESINNKDKNESKELKNEEKKSGGIIRYANEEDSSNEDSSNEEKWHEKLKNENTNRSSSIFQKLKQSINTKKEIKERMGYENEEMSYSKDSSKENSFGDEKNGEYDTSSLFDKIKLIKKDEDKKKELKESEYENEEIGYNRNQHSPRENKMGDNPQPNQIDHKKNSINDKELLLKSLSQFKIEKKGLIVKKSIESSMLKKSDFDKNPQDSNENREAEKIDLSDKKTASVQRTNTSEKVTYFFNMKKQYEEKDLPKSYVQEEFYWNEQFQTSYEFRLKSENSAMKQIIKQKELMSAIETEFISTAKRIGGVIINEIYLPLEEKTIKPSQVGGIIGTHLFFFFFLFYLFFCFINNS